MIDLLREADPDVILAPSPEDYHPDHRYLSQLVFDSYFQKGLPHIPNQTRSACRFGDAQIYHMDTLAGINFTPAEYVDITPVMDIKRRMLACHASQLTAVSELAHTNLIDMIDIQGRFRGLAARCTHAEAFRRVDAFQRGLTRRVLP